MNLPHPQMTTVKVSEEDNNHNNEDDDEGKVNINDKSTNVSHPSLKGVFEKSPNLGHPSLKEVYTKSPNIGHPFLKAEGASIGFITLKGVLASQCLL